MKLLSTNIGVLFASSLSSITYFVVDGASASLVDHRKGGGNKNVQVEPDETNDVSTRT